MNYLLLMAAANNPCSGSTFFGLRTWWYYLPKTDFDGSCRISHFQVFPSSEIPLVLLAVVDDLLIAAGLIAVGFVIYGGVQYIASQGNPENTARAQSTILNALIGLAISIVAIAFVSFLGNSLGG